MTALTKQGPASYYCASLAGLYPLLEASDYCSIPTKSQYEAARYQRARSILVIYTNGTVLLQGADLDTPRVLFANLMHAEQSELPF